MMKMQTRISTQLQRSISTIGLLIGLIFAATQAQAQFPDQRFYRFYRPVTQSYFYTTSPKSGLAAEKEGYHLQSVLATVWSFDGSGRLPIYRLYNTVQGDHFYTISFGEVEWAVLFMGYDYQGIEGYAYAVPLKGTVPVYSCYRWNNIYDVILWGAPYLPADRLYTTNEKELNYAIQNLGYTAPGISFYAFP